MSNALRMLPCMALAVAGLLTSSGPALAAPAVNGTVFETDGTPLLSVVVNVTVTDSKSNVIGTARSSTTTGAYVVTFTGTPQTDNIINIKYQRQAGIMSVSFAVSYAVAAEKISPIVPK